MKLDELKKQWREEMDTVQQYDGVALTELKSKISQLNAYSLYEDVRDISLWFFVALFYGLHWLLASNTVWLEKFGLIVILSTCFFIIFKTLRIRAGGRALEWTLSARISSEITRMEQKSRLLMQAATWYLAPVFVGICLVPIGRLHNKTAEYVFDLYHLSYIIFCILMVLIGYWWSRRVVVTKYAPVIADLKKLQKELAES